MTGFGDYRPYAGSVKDALAEIDAAPNMRDEVAQWNSDNAQTVGATRETQIDPVIEDELLTQTTCPLEMLGKTSKLGPAARAAAVVEERRAAYGPPTRNFERIVALWNVALADKLKPGVKLTPADHAQLMRLVKEARLIETPDHDDSLVDICGYADCQSMVVK